MVFLFSVITAQSSGNWLFQTFSMDYLTSFPVVGEYMTVLIGFVGSMIIGIVAANIIQLILRLTIAKPARTPKGLGDPSKSISDELIAAMNAKLHVSLSAEDKAWITAQNERIIGKIEEQRTASLTNVDVGLISHSTPDADVKAEGQLVKGSPKPDQSSTATQKDQVKILQRQERSQVDRKPVFCRDCGAENPASFRFCVKCGKPIS
jgi:hypothetical protein